MEDGGVIDEEFLKVRCESLGAEKMKNYARIFRRTHGETLGRIVEGWERRDLDLLRRDAHTLKGAASALGMSELSALAARIEASAREGRKDELPEAVSEMRPVYDRALDVLADFLNARRPAG